MQQTSQTTFRWRRLWCLVCLSMLAACSSADEKPDQPEEQVAEKPTDEQAAESAEPESAPKEPIKETDTQEQLSTGELTEDFKSDLSDALDDAHSGDRDDAIAELQRLVDDAGGGFLAAYNLGVIYESEGDYQKAASRYSQALKKNPGFSAGLYNLVRLYMRLGQVSDAEKLARKYVEQRPDNIDHRAIALQVTLRQGKYEEVIRKAKRLLRRDEKNVAAMTAMAEANIQLDRNELAEAILDRIRELDPDRPEIYFKYAKIRRRNDQITDAITLLKKAIEYRPNYPEAHNNLGVLYHEASDYKAAADQFRAATKDYPDYKEAYLNLGNALKGQGKFRKAEDAFKKALEIDASYGDALFNLGVLYLDSDLEGIDKIAQLETSIEYLNKYKKAVGSKMAAGDPAEKYIQEARKSIEVEKQRQEMMRQAQMQAEDDSGGEESDDQEEAAADQQ